MTMRALSIPFGKASVVLGLAALTALACGSEIEEPPASDPPPRSSGAFDVNDDDGGEADRGSSGCMTDSKRAQKQPVDMIIGLDTSFSMDFDDKWPNVRDALKAFVNNPAYADLGLGLQFFPIRKQCSVAEYEQLAVPLALQPDAAPKISAALDGRQMSGGTPMVPLLEGLTNYLRANAAPGRKPVIVLATDGIPDDTCLAGSSGVRPNTLDDAIAVVSDALSGAQITTFVIGVGGELSALDAIAAAGGTTKATLVDSGSGAQATFLEALEGIRRTAIPCDYDIPSGTIKPKATNVTYASGGVTKQLVFVGNEAGCDKAKDGEGWYFDDEAAPSKVILCDAICSAAKDDDGASVDLEFGCPRLEIK